ncbi:unnamed protein product [Tilletia controversa]|uniref:Uncharacterized protein n=1 Tax=Tilletia controversa TaxID=13291 RepID=A0A8X7MWI4_9BASI|nr:hypothetical protein CF328_g6796 [Tilletia controversa]KAE8252147.1 hypothetical protein A4X06_0g2402 [Tilletia controversa]CAD6954890.1 unnamed protein product [Tilletia controversa]CAD6961904.1 unnamed protein product [Tilletia controversa]CAD6974519.1 unnamed protein product [Tilletia controversa]
MADSPKRPPASHEGQLDLRTFLTSIHADLDAPASSTSSPSPTTTTPSLPASARVTLLDAQLDAVHAQIRHTLTKHADLLVKAGTESVRLHRDLSALSAQVDHFETETQPQIQDRIPDDSPLPAALAAYSRANEQALFEAYTLSTLRSLHSAVSSLEQLESALSSSSTSDAKLAHLAEQAQRACAEIGIGIGEAEMTQGKEFGWLTRSVPALPSTTLKSWQKEGNEADLPAVRLLGPRLEEALRKKDAVLRRRAQKGRPTEHGGGGPSSKSPLSPADEVRRKARSLLQATEGWKAVSVLDVSAVAGSSDDGDDRSRLAPTSPLVGGRGMQLPSKKNAHLRPQQQQQQQPTCTISQRSLDLVTLAEETLTQARMRAKRLSREMAGGSLSTNDDEEGDIREARLRAIAALLRSLPDIFSLHLALMPTLHPVALFTDASLALQFANDCSHLSSQCVRLGNVLLIASNVREELGRLVNGRGAEGVVRKAVEGAAGGLEEVGQALSGLGLRVLNRQMMNTR